MDHRKDQSEAGQGAECLARDIRAKAEELRDLVKRIELAIDEQHEHAKATHDVDEMQRLTDADPYRWIADAKHSLQAGIMFAERAVSQTTSF